MKNLKTALRNPRRESKPWALWIWNREITELELAQQLTSFIEFGFGGVAIRPGTEMSPAYLSEEYISRLETVCSMAESAGIGVRIADDFSLPCNGFFQEPAQKQSSLRSQTITLEYTKLIEAKAEFVMSVERPDEMIILAAHSYPNGQVDLDSCKEIHPQQNQITFQAGSQDTRVMVFRKSFLIDPAGHYIPNPFNPKAAQAYIQNVLEPLKATFSKYIPTTLEGFITEMPAVLPAENSIPWDDDLVVKYRSKYKRDLLKILPGLFFDVDEKSVRSRSHFYNYMSQSMYERFAGQLEAWAKKYRLSQWVLTPERDILRSDGVLLEQFCIPSITLSSVGIQNQEGTDQNYHILRMMADANTVEYRRETVTVIGRNRMGDGATVQSLKNEIDCAMLNGPTKILIDGMYFNIEHRNQVRTPINPNWYYPGWDQIKDLCGYATHLAEANSQPDLHVVRSVAVVMPSASIMAEYIPKNNESAETASTNLRKITNSLEGENIPYDIISESRLLSCSVRVNGEFGAADRIRKGNYQAVIIPYARYISKSLLVFLEKVSVKKGTIVFIDEPPVGCLEDGISEVFTDRVEKLVRTKRSCVHVKPVEEVCDTLQGVSCPAKILVNGKSCQDLYSSFISNTHYDQILIHNTADRADYYAEIELPAGKQVALVDCNEGELYKIEDIRNEANQTVFGLSFDPKQTYLLAVADDLEELAIVSPDHPVNKYRTTARKYRIMLKDKWSFLPDSLNVLPLANWNMRIGLSRETGGYSHYSEAYFEIKHIPEICVLVLCGINDSRQSATLGGSYEIAINGATIQPYNAQGQNPDEPIPAWGKYCGSRALKYDLRDYILNGVNRISFRSVGEYSDPQPMIYPPVIAGDFSISKGAKGWTIDEPASMVGYDSWTRHGYPYFSGVGIYSQDFEVPTQFSRIVLKFSQATGPVHVTLNSKDLGVLKWHPLEVDITDICEKRRNELVVRVSNTMDNLLRMNGRASGFMGEAYLDIYQE
ncbi:MAG: hypothetical protein ACOC41_07810 [Chitinivibrionales bacterium]